MAENNLSDLIRFIETDVYGREMREHIHDAFEILAQSSLTAEEKAKIADSILYVPQTLNDDQKQIARNNIGAAKAGDSGRGWTEEQIDLLESFKEFFDSMKDHIGYDENSADGAGQTAAKDAVDALASLITSLRTVPRELEYITVALKEDVTPMNGRSIQLNELEVTGHYSDGTSSTIESGYELVSPSDGVWAYPTTTIRVKYLWKGTLYTSPSAEISLSSDAYAWITIDSNSDKEHLNYAVSIGGAEQQFDSYGRIKVLPINKNSGIIVTIIVKSDYSADKELDPSSTATMGGDPMQGAGAGIWGESQITGDVVIKGVSKNKEAITYTATFVVDGNPYDTVTFEAGATVLPRVPSVPTKSHYTGEWEQYTLADADITINAVYTAIQYTITFRDDGGDHPRYYTEPTAESINVPDPTPRTDYTVAWPSWSVAYDNTQVVEAVYTEIVAAGVSMEVIRPGTTKSGKITIEPNSSVTQYSSHLPVTESKSLAFDVSNFTGVAGEGCPTHCKITALSTPSANTLIKSEFDIEMDGDTPTVKLGTLTGTGMYSMQYVEVGTTNYPYGGLGLYPRAQFDSGITYKIELSW